MTTLALIAVGTVRLGVCRRALSGVWEHGKNNDSNT